ncbi:tail fiber domain-containing protein [Enterobacter sp.]|uniref:tail fiber domain-containing protein n=1 Tax=Enterobacter sp. TaxID=42895 RepID=UPI00296E64CF|nr:tail fiber domain-containing protein [Enterobacter sp.]
MIYNTGTIAINGNAATGTGTNWTAPASQIRAGQTLIVLSNPVQMFQIAAVNSATSLTVTPAASPALSAQNYGILVTDSLSVDGLAQSISQLIKEYDENIGAWESFATTSANQSVTVTINGQSVSIPAIGKLLQKGSNGALQVKDGGTGATDAAGARINLGLGYGATAGTVAQGNDSRLSTIDGKSGGTLSSTVFIKGPSPEVTPVNGTETSAPLFDSGFSSGIYNQVHVAFHATVVQGSGSKAVIAIQTSGVGAYTRYMFDQSGNATAPGSWVPTSDVRLKTNIKRIEDPLVKMGKLQGCTWTRLDTGLPGIGFLAQEVADVFPDVVTRGQDVTLADGSVVEGVLSPDTYGVAAALHHEAILALIDEVNELKRMLSLKN